MSSCVFATVLALLAAAPRQEPSPDAETLLKQVEEGSKPAEDALVRLGLPAMPALRARMVTSSRELWVRLDRILLQIETDERRRRFRAEAGKVSVKIENKPFNEIIPELEGLIGVPLEKSELKNPVAVDLKDVFPLEAFDRACAAAKIEWRAEWGIRSEKIVPEVLFGGAREPAHPRSARHVKYAKNFRIGVIGMTVQRRRTPWSDEASAWVSGVIQPSPGLGQVQLQRLNVSRVVVDEGTILHWAGPVKAPQPFPSARLAGPGPSMSSMPFMQVITPPPPEARTYSLLGGTAEVRGEVGRRYMSLEASEAAIGRSVDFEGLTLTLAFFHKADGKVTVGISHKGLRRDAETPENQTRVDGQGSPILRLRDGSNLHPMKVNRVLGKEPYIQFVFETKSEPAEVRFVTHSVWESDTVEFEFRDLPIR